MNLNSYVNLIEEDLLPNIYLSSEKMFNPIVVINHSKTWRTIGRGNYAAVFENDFNRYWVVKVYGRNHEEINKEIEVYQKLGKHDSFSTLFASGENYLVLKKLEGITLFNAVIEGIQIPESVIEDIDYGLQYAKTKGLNPFDVHGKNVIMNGKRGYIVDISDFHKTGYCSKWEDVKKGYYRIYKPCLYKRHPSVPFFIMEAVRKGYRIYSKCKNVLRNKFKRGSK